MSSSSDSGDDPFDDPDEEAYIAMFINILISAVITYTEGLYNRQAYHTSILSGHAWVLELLTGHPDHIHCELGVRRHVFESLVSNLRWLGYKDSRDVTLHEQLAIFLYTSVTGLSTRHVGERFQRASSTISR